MPLLRHKRVVVLVGAYALILFVVFVYKAPAMARGFVRTGNFFFGGGSSHVYNLSAADSFYKIALFLDPSVPDAWHQRARIAFLRGDFKSAQSMINTQLLIHGDSFMASYYIHGLIYGYEKKYSQAERDFSKFLTWDPTNWAANNDLAWIYFAEGKYKESAAQAENGMKYNVGNPWLLTMHAMAVYNLGERTQAEKELLQAKTKAATLTEAEWIHSYPGNDPKIASEGLASFRATIEKDLQLVHTGAPAQ